VPVFERTWGFESPLAHLLQGRTMNDDGMD
jgi:hypothetical protein